MLHYRQVVPIDLRSLFGLRVVKRSLLTRDPVVAKLRAYALSTYVGISFARARRLLVTHKDDKSLPVLDVDDPSSPFYIPSYKIEKTRDGFSLATDGSDKDHKHALEALRTLLGSGAAAAEPAATLVAPVAVVQAPVPTGIGIGEAARKYQLTLDARTVPDKTRSQKRASINGFAAWRGAKHPLNTCTRTDVSEWVQSLRATNLATPTLANKTSYLKAFFEWAQTAGHFPKGDNPAQGQVKYGVREKRARRKLGFEAFTTDQLAVIYGSKFSALRDDIRWGALLGLYTGARVSEIGQLHLDNFVVEDGVPCIRITGDGEGQRLKTDASERSVPLHPQLIAMGLLDYVASLRKVGKTRLFPKTKVGSVNGHGNFLSAAFGRYIAKLGVKPKMGKIGFHSLRKTIVQQMQSEGVPSEFRAQYVGHELGDEHHAAYSRQYSMAELAAKVHPALTFETTLVDRKK
jgi:integrase